MRPDTLKRRHRLNELKLELRAHNAAIRLVTKEIKTLKRRKMKPGRGRTKGNANENVTAKQIIAAFAEFGIKGTDCYRTPSSGGHRFAKKEDPGDLVISKKLAKIFPFEVECKHYKDIDIYPFLANSKLWKKSWLPRKWLAQTVAAAQHRKGRHPLLVMRMNGQPALAALPGLYPLVTYLTPRLRFLPFKGEHWYLVRFDRLLRVIAREYREGSKTV